MGHRIDLSHMVAKFRHILPRIGIQLTAHVVPDRFCIVETWIFFLGDWGDADHGSSDRFSTSLIL